MKAAFGRKKGVSNVEVVVRGEFEDSFHGTCRRCKLNGRVNWGASNISNFLKHMREHVEDGDLVQPELIGAVTSLVGKKMPAHWASRQHWSWTTTTGSNVFQTSGVENIASFTYQIAEDPPEPEDDATDEDDPE